VLSAEATKTNFLVFGLTQWNHEPTTYRIRGEHANHYTTDAVLSLYTSINGSCSAINWDAFAVIVIF
jgi:hypothetical protein